MENENQDANALDMTRILSGLAQQKESANSRLITNRKRVHRTLKRLGVTKVIVSYSGCGDSGQIDSIQILKNES